MAPALLRYLRVEVHGLQFVPNAGAVLLAPNHLSILDHVVVWAAAPRSVSFLGKEELARGLFGRLNVAMGMVPIARGSADREALGAVAQILQQGEPVVVFPEGTRSPTGELFRFRGGVARLAAEANCVVVPVGLVGTARVWPKGARVPVARPPRGVVQVHFGEPLAPPEEAGAARREFLAVLWQQVAALSAQSMADRFAPITDAPGVPENEG